MPHAPLISLFLVAQIIFGEKYRSFSSSLCSLLYSPVTLSLSGPDIFLSTLFLNTLSLFLGLALDAIFELCYSLQ